MRRTLMLLALLMAAGGCSRTPSPEESPAAGPFQKCDVEKLSTAELRAMNRAGSIALLSYMCGAGTSFESLYDKGCEQKSTGMVLQIPPLQGQMPDPRQDADYQFFYRTVQKDGGTVTETDFRPKRVGLAGSLAVGTSTYCNALGRAAERAELQMSRDEINRAVELLKSPPPGR